MFWWVLKAQTFVLFFPCHNDFSSISRNDHCPPDLKSPENAVLSFLVLSYVYLQINLYYLGFPTKQKLKHTKSKKVNLLNLGKPRRQADVLTVTVLSYLFRWMDDLVFPTTDYHVFWLRVPFNKRK